MEFWCSVSRHFPQMQPSVDHKTHSDTFLYREMWYGHTRPILNVSKYQTHQHIPYAVKCDMVQQTDPPNTVNKRHKRGLIFQVSAILKDNGTKGENCYIWANFPDLLDFVRIFLIRSLPLIGHLCDPSLEILEMCCMIQHTNTQHDVIVSSTLTRHMLIAIR